MTVSFPMELDFPTQICHIYIYFVLHSTVYTHSEIEIDLYDYDK